MPTTEHRDPSRVARQAQMRDQNLGVALRGIVDAPAPVSRAQLAAAEGLARATVSGLVDHLIEARLVRELDPAQTQRAGRPAVPLAPARGTVAGVGMEINVDYLGVRAIDLSGDVLAEHVELDDLRGADAGAVLDRLAALAAPVVQDLQARGIRVAGTALALPGLVDRVTGPLRVAPNLGWRDVDVVAAVSAHPALAALPPRVANEANLAARAEAHARGGSPSFAYVSGEVGIGGAIVLDGEIVPGRHGWSGEIGHIVVDAFRGPRASDGSLEALAGQDAMLRAAGLPQTARLDALLDALATGDARASAAVAQAARALGVALASVANVVDVGEVVLGGTFGQLFDHVHDEVAARLDELVIFAPWSPLQVSPARAGQYPAMTGGALAALARLLADPAQWLRQQPTP
ncbi:ROK family protein [Cellulomonas fengjieae]|uniref:ROK family protein n=1 Tax=Cellulomonas fengjieae TaxID=2819978 RepID=A0ABS3SH05_9CELL|nr:ROK family protein [Cellulomonas fengjieae]MBO3085031.1 ROK family protein [Cellulomonas fengjieae]QVI66374.1 ROK family protein [Cellulomonas fengjieae]